MEAKPIITCHGNQTLFSSLHQIVVNGLPKEVCEWRRSFGRAPRSVQLEGSFVPYDPDILPEEDTKTLVSRPYFHIYWTDCDLDTYKQSVKDELMEWHAALRAKNIPDWLIVVVIPDESKIKSKLLPRSSVADKVRSDFCSKQPERSAVVIEPLKSEPKSVESWNHFFQKLRTLLLQAYNRHLNKYEENMRALREKRNEPGWTYFEYFSVQEELGFMLEILGLKDDALIQYDELEAMFDQFVENHANGEMVKWLSPLVRPCKSWLGLSLAKSLDHDLRDRVKHSLTSLLEFRNYLFSRQAALLFSMGRAWEVAERALNFLHNTVVEIKCLEVEVPEGGLECWAVLSGLEILAACQKHDTGQVDKCALFTAHLWDHIRNKLKKLGQMYGLMPGITPSSKQLSHLVDLMAGMISDDVESVAKVRPVDKLREALSSSESFKKHYLETCELAMGTYKHISRFRSSRMIGRDLAHFYMKAGEPAKAEAFLCDAIKLYSQEGWTRLAHGTLRELAACQKLIGEKSRFLGTALEITCSNCLDETDRVQHFNDIITVLKENVNLSVQGQGIMELKQIKLMQNMAKTDDLVTMTIHFISHLPQPVICDTIQVALTPCPAFQLTKINQEGDSKSVQRKSSLPWESQMRLILIQTGFLHSFSDTHFLPKFVHEPCMRRQGRVIVAGLACDNAPELLKRTDSSASEVVSPELIVKGDYSMCFLASDVLIQPGLNEVELVMRAGGEGTFYPSQSCVMIKGLEILQSLPASDLQLHVACHGPRITLTPKNSVFDFILGIEQSATLTFYTGSQNLLNDTVATLHSTPALTVKTLDGDENRLRLQAQIPHTSCDLEISIYMPFLLVCQLPVQLRKYVQISLEGSSKEYMVITSPQLSASNCMFSFINQGKDWSGKLKQEENIHEHHELDVNAMFVCQFTCSLDLAQQPRSFNYKCHLSHFQTWYTVDYSLSGKSQSTVSVSFESSRGDSRDVVGYQAGQMHMLNLSVTPVAAHCSPFRPELLAYRIAADPSIWALLGKTTGVFSVKDHPFRAQLNVIPLAAGFRHLPRVQLYRYVGDQKQHNEDDEEVWVKRKGAGDTRLTSEPHSGEDCDLDLDGLEELTESRVYNSSLAKQVHVFPTAATSDMEVCVAV
ncbi:LOW QUALITY PROTEIN: trafficking protein particle complex subunit 10-like [Pomacea canaliculata]|uniref:LOW QUALITY PROTEIN: trafficking protein particle complex subunit 10-like n=1 Tax=Pomacea canaliculata TaxID=400727 RepID=UPI000D73B409|nr:LOW QUALITY PROTEIN: trafficking protein particle complex subunit 10-like [Pomacea canaliculata]